jgi:hypothetical protein
MQEHRFTGCINGLVIFRVPEFGTRARFTIDDAGRSPVVCAVEGDVAREFIARYCEATVSRSVGFTNLDRQPPPPIHPGVPDIAYARCKSRETPVSQHEAPATDDL